MSPSSRWWSGAAINRVLAPAWALMYLYLGTTSTPPTIPVGGRVDLVAHLGASILLAALVADVLPGKRPRRWIWAGMTSFLVGLTIEAVQTGVPTRDFDWLDLAVDIVGAAAGATAHWAAARRFRRRVLSTGVAALGLATLLLAGLTLLPS